MTAFDSIQRLPLPAGKSARWAAQEYTRWLGRVFGPWLRVADDGEGALLYLARGLPSPLLVLREAPGSGDDHVVFAVTGGLLFRNLAGAALCTFEFRAEGADLVTGLFGFRSSMPAPLYRVTQYVAHDAVMARFGKHLRGVAASSAR